MKICKCGGSKWEVREIGVYCLYCGARRKRDIVAVTKRISDLIGDGFTPSEAQTLYTSLQMISTGSSPENN